MAIGSMISQRSTRRVRAFTILELIVVLSIMTIMAGVLVPSITSFLTAQRTTQARTILRSCAEAMTRRFAYMATNLEFQYVLELNFPADDLTAGAPPLPSGDNNGAVAFYFPYDPSDSSKSIRQLSNDSAIPASSFTFGIDVPPGGPYLTTSQQASGASAGKDLLLDPWGREVIFQVIPGNDLFWRPQSIWCLGPDPDITWNDPSLKIYLHPYRELALASQKRMEVINRAILAYNREHLPSDPFPNYPGKTYPVYWDRNLNLAADNTVYARLVNRGYLERPRLPNSGPFVDLYAFDPWSFCYLTEFEANHMIPPLSPFDGTLPDSQVVQRVICGSMANPGHYCGKNAADCNYL